MKTVISEETLKYIIHRLLEKFNIAVLDSEKDLNNEINLGRRLAYYEVLDMLKSELDIADVDLKEVGLDIDLESKL